MMMANLEQQIAGAVRYFWKTRSTQQRKQKGTGKKDQGDRGAVTGGGQLDGFIKLLSDLVIESGTTSSGIPKASIITDKNVELPGFFRPTKEWDLLIVADGHLLASLELKSHIGPSFGNNYNNRTEEALGSATDLWTAYREGAFSASQRPWWAISCCLRMIRDHELQSMCGNPISEFSTNSEGRPMASDMRSYV